MVYVYLIGMPAALLGSFLLLVAFEARSHRRILAGKRDRFDVKVSRITFVAKHVDWGAFFHDLVRTMLDRMLHDVAHGVLIAVRAIERELTGVVRTLRARREHPEISTPRNARPSRLQSAVSYVQQTVRRAKKTPVKSTPPRKAFRKRIWYK